MKSFRDLIAWQKAMTLVTEIYSLSSEFPKEEKFGLSSQMRRAAVSVPSNIAEGFGRNSPGEFTRFLQIASGSLYELQTQLEISRNLGFSDPDRVTQLITSSNEVGKIISGLIRSISANSSNRISEDPLIYSVD